ncbi:MAG: cytochrome c biogenesis protein CcsA [Pirellulaceae bacterium]
MSTGTWSDSQSNVTRSRTSTQSASLPFTILKLLGSLKITVWMFALAILIVLFGTLAQDEMDLAQVKREFFNCWIASVPLDILLPTTLYPHDAPILGGIGIYFPGGATIGLVLLINLIAAKTTRFSVQAKGAKLAAGTTIALAGLGLVLLVIAGGHTADGLQGKPPVSYETLWGMLKAGFVVLTVALFGYALRAKLPSLARAFVWFAAAVFLALSVVIFAGGESVRLDDPGLRIVWQLLQATIASSVVLAGLWMVFGRRGGNVLIHAGVGLLMVGQFVWGDRQIEQRIGLAEGTSTNLAVIEDEIEIVIIDSSDPEEDVVYALPEALIRRADRTKEVIDDPELPFKLRIVDWMRNSHLANLNDKVENLATAGYGLQALAIEDKPLGAAIMDDRNISSAYVEVIDRETDESVDILMLSQQRNDLSQLTASMRPDVYEPVTVNSKSYEMAIRFRQVRKPYDVYLKDVERINYSGTDTPRDYSSRIVITMRDEPDTSQEGKTWMNNPIRYKGETFYQSRYNKIPLNDRETIETTGLQVVKNAGWVIPYVACMMVFVGMFAHFGGTFVTFANRYSRATSKAEKKAPNPLHGVHIAAGVIAGLALPVIVAGLMLWPKTYSRNEVDWTAIGRLPVQHEGRIKPVDTVARNLLQTFSKPIFGFTPAVVDSQENEYKPSQWLLGVMAQQEWVRDARIIRIDTPDVRQYFDLEERKGHRYSLNELDGRLGDFREKISPLLAKLRDNEQELDDLDFVDKKFVELQSSLNAYDLLMFSYQMPRLPELSENPTEEEERLFMSSIMQTFDMTQRLEAGGPPAIIPPEGDATERNLVDAKWQAYGPAVFKAYLGRRMGVASGEPNPAIFSFSAILDAVRADDAKELNKAVGDYQELLASMPLANAKIPSAAAESWLYKFNPTMQGVALYILAILLSFASFLFRLDFLRRTTFWLLVGVLIIHTVAIVGRIYVTGKAPVINLYSSAVFIGWVLVVFSLVLEKIHPLGIANLVAAVAGASTLSVARFLDTSDSMHVLQAVLDTQFWLSTHVITVTAGYAVTFLAGLLGIVALAHRLFTGYDAYPPAKRPKEDQVLQQVLYSMIYGILCFAIFFSFIGTVLGGLWADDSWGRFWGWDPKENGALMIVLWNALILHARWDRQVGQRGFAVLAVLGNIVTAWSWFGTNQLGIGLHSYGFTKHALVSLGVFMGVNLLIAGVALALTSAMSKGARQRLDS